MSARATVRLYLLCVLCQLVISAHTIAKEYVCRDPDTGTLHEINTTWRSTTFCGNYTCKIRRINTGQQPSKVFVSLFNPQARTNSHDQNNHTSKFSLSKILPDLTKDNDRLLNQAEIHKITELLHSVKKSDLQAVIELYNVAQEMYEDMKVAEPTADKRTSQASDDSSKTIQLKTSYWYQPANEHGKVNDLNTEGSEYKGTTVYPARPYSYAQPYYYSQSYTNYPTYFTGSLLNKGDFGKLGYANQQMYRQGSPTYYQQKNVYDVPGSTPQNPCNPCARTYPYQMPVNYPQQQAYNMYPYQQLLYNNTAPVHSYNNYYKANPWAYYDYYKNLAYPRPSQIQSNPQMEVEKTADTENVNAEDKEDDKSWKTDPLSEEIINEIRANIAQRSKLINIPLKKRIKLERLSKVIKLDQNNRNTRSISTGGDTVDSQGKHTKERDLSSNNETNTKNIEADKEILETYVEKVTCEETTELGFFKIGNMTKPFPDCCPQKIEDKQR